MKARQLLLAGGLGLLALAGTASAQQGPYVSQKMYVVIRFNQDRQPWDYALQIGSAAAMPLMGVSPSTNSAVYVVPNETDLLTGEVAAKNQNIVLRQFPNVIQSYNYGSNVPLPRDIQSTRTAQPDNGYPPANGRYDDNSNYNSRGRRYGQYRLTNRDRMTVQDWADQNRVYIPRIQVGTALDQSILAQARQAPIELTSRLPSAPGDYRFLIVSDNLVVVDGRNVVVDFVEFDR